MKLAQGLLATNAFLKTQSRTPLAPASAKLRMAMMDGQREIWKIRNDLKFNKPIQPAEERRIEKAFRVLTRLKAELLWKYTGINQDEDSNTTGEMAKKTICTSG